MTPDRQVLHATCVAWRDRGLLILGGSGSGKSALALKLIALGAALVSDDQVAIETDADPAGLRATCPRDAIRGMIEARGFGILHMPAQDSARLVLALDLDRIEGARLPPARQVTFLGQALPLAHAPKGDHLPFALYCHLTGARRDLGPVTGPDLAEDWGLEDRHGSDGQR